MIVAMAEDVRVIIIKLADRLHNLREIEYLGKQKQMQKARETLEVYAPLERGDAGAVRKRGVDLGRLPRLLHLLLLARGPSPTEGGQAGAGRVADSRAR